MPGGIWLGLQQTREDADPQKIRLLWATPTRGHPPLPSVSDRRETMPCSPWAHLGVVASKGKGERGRRLPISPVRGFQGQLLRAKVRDGAARPPPHSPRPPARRQHSGAPSLSQRAWRPLTCSAGLRPGSGVRRRGALGAERRPPLQPGSRSGWGATGSWAGAGSVQSALPLCFGCRPSSHLQRLLTAPHPASALTLPGGLRDARSSDSRPPGGAGFTAGPPSVARSARVRRGERGV